MNTEQVARELRQVTDERDRGTLSLTDYRRRRAELLDHLVGLQPRKDLDTTRPRAAEPTPRAAAPPAAAAAPDAAKSVAPAKVPSVKSEAATKAGSGPPVMLIVAAVGVVAIAASLWLWLGRSHPTPTASEAVTNADVAAPAGAGGPSPIDVFLKRGDWSDSAISALNSAWWSMSDAEILATLTSDGSRQLADEVSTRLAARGTRGGPAPLDPDAPLVLLARNLNVPVPASAIGPHSAATEPATLASAKPATASAPLAAAPAITAAVQNPAPAKAVATKPNVALPAAAPPAAVAVADAAHGANAAPDPCASAKRRRCHDEVAPGRPGPDLVVLPPGRFRMGSALTAEEQPVHDVAVLRPYAMTRYEVTVGQWRAFCEASGRGACGSGSDDMPVVNVSWKDAVDYAKWLSDQTGRHYRLPSEAEWEYAARADTTGEPGHELPSLNPNTDARYAAPGGPQPAGPTGADDPTFRANGFGLIHLLGNVREWVQDAWIADYRSAPSDAAPREGDGMVRVVRGGSFRDGPEHVRPGAREHLDATAKDVQTGFRLVREMRGG